MAGLRISPSSPPVQQTRTQWTPSAWYLATVDSTLGGLVVGVGVHAEQAKLIGHPYQDMAPGTLLGARGPAGLYDGPDARADPSSASCSPARTSPSATSSQRRCATTSTSSVTPTSGEALLVDPAYDVRALVGWLERGRAAPGRCTGYPLPRRPCGRGHFRRAHRGPGRPARAGRRARCTCKRTRCRGWWR